MRKLLRFAKYCDGPEQLFPWELRLKLGHYNLQGSIIASLVFSFVVFMLSVMAHAQQPAKVPRIAYVASSSLATNADRVEAFKQGLRELGYVEGKNLVVEWRFADGDDSRLPGLVAELVRLKVDIIVAGGPAVTGVAQKATSTIPIVMGFHLDPVGSGVIASLARPGGNITGLSSLSPEISGKQLELLKEVVPALARVAIIGNSTEPGHAQVLKELELAAGALKLKLQVRDVLDGKNIATAYQAARKDRADAVLLLNSTVLNSHRAQLVDLAVKHRLPATYPFPQYVEGGGLMSYGTNYSDLFRRAATYVDKILKGRTPADLPVEQPIKFEFVVNLKAAKQIALRIPPNVLARADRVIK